MAFDPVTGKMITDKVVDAATEPAGGGFFSDLLSSPFRFLKGLLMAPINGVVGIGKGIFSNTIGNPLGVLMNSAIGLGLIKFAPDLVAWLPFKLGDKKVGQVVADHMVEGGTPAAIKDSLIAGVAISAVMGAGRGALSAGVDTAEGDVAGKIGGGIGTVATLAGLGMLAFAAMKDKNVGFGGEGDAAATKTPAPTPAATAATKGKTKQ